MSDSTPTSKSPFPQGFERDAKTLLLAFDMKGINLPTLQHNLERLGIEFVPDPDVRPAPALQRPTIEPAGFEPVMMEFADDPDHVYEAQTGAVFSVHTGEHVGFIDMSEEPYGELALPAGEPVGEEPAEAPIGPPPEGIEFVDPDGESDEVALPRPSAFEDEQIDDTEEPS